MCAAAPARAHSASAEGARHMQKTRATSQTLTRTSHRLRRTSRNSSQHLPPPPHAPSILAAGQPPVRQSPRLRGMSDRYLFSEPGLEAADKVAVGEGARARRREAGAAASRSCSTVEPFLPAIIALMAAAPTTDASL